MEILLSAFITWKQKRESGGGDENHRTEHSERERLKKHTFHNWKRRKWEMAARSFVNQQSKLMMGQASNSFQCVAPGQQWWRTGHGSLRADRRGAESKCKPASPGAGVASPVVVRQEKIRAKLRIGTGARRFPRKRIDMQIRSSKEQANQRVHNIHTLGRFNQRRVKESIDNSCVQLAYYYY